jgi:hypothetical protein
LSPSSDRDREVLGRPSAVDDREIGPALSDELDRLGHVAALTDDVDSCALEQARQPLAKEDIVVASATRVRLMVPLAIIG